LEPLEHGPPRARKPVPSPQAHGFAAGAQAAGHIRCMQALCQQQDNLCPETEMLRCFMGAYERQQLLAFSLGERDWGRCGTRPRRLLCALNVGAQGTEPFYKSKACYKRETFLRQAVLG
jgi:hypothetical protein